TEDAERLFVALETGQRLRVIAVDIDSVFAAVVLADLRASLLGGLGEFLRRCAVCFKLLFDELVGASSLAASDEHLRFEHFTRSVLLAGDVSNDIPIGEIPVDL